MKDIFGVHMKRCGALFFVGSVIALAIAYVAQMFFGLVPCKLCLYERVPYFIALIPSIIMMFKSFKGLFFVVVICYVAGIIISIYHAGLEYGWFTDFLHCAGDVGFGTSLEDIKANLLSKEEVVSCKVPSFVFMGISLSGWNAVYAISILICAFLLRVRYTRDNRGIVGVM
ncbi:disulfide bond formation protein B [Anaplasma phagocytophilum]|uniref:disulfide bond formation protein B n=1 Tax=Anaplasma phagocytophilum TaxID=948 RepID=UPI00200E111A|nr:disulfide bond formation protein B [Anaplasma phagocytophilum]